MALKFHREGYTNFREVMKERDYTSDNHHVSWLYTARKAAEREHEALTTLYPDVSFHVRSTRTDTPSSWRSSMGSNSRARNSNPHRWSPSSISS